MPRDSNGNTQPLPGTIVSTGQNILPSQHNPALVDIYNMLTQSLSRDGQGGMRAVLDMNNYPIINVGSSDIPSSVATRAMLDEVRALVSSACPPGTKGEFMLKSAPTGWIPLNGGTIGNTGSGATTRAAADTLDLYTVLWNQFSNAELAIQDSAGNFTTRGGSAILDFNALKRLRIHNARSRFSRGWDGGMGYDPSLTVGVVQDDAVKRHTHTGTANPHSHVVPSRIRAFYSNAPASTRIASTNAQSVPDSTPDPMTTNSVSVTFTTNENTGTGSATENRPRSLVTLVCIKL